MNFSRRKPRHCSQMAREKSSDWRYRQIEKGSPKRSRPNIVRLAKQHKQD